MKYLYKTTDKFNVENLVILAQYLLALPDDYDAFDMNSYMAQPDSVLLTQPQIISENCGAVACAIGHGPAAGILPLPGARFSWEKYCNRVFIDGWAWQPQWEWCFSAAWTHIDNTPAGAGRRILYMLNHGIPYRFHHRDPATWLQTVAIYNAVELD